MTRQPEGNQQANGSFQPCASIAAVLCSRSPTSQSQVHVRACSSKASYTTCHPEKGHVQPAENKQTPRDQRTRGTETVKQAEYMTVRVPKGPKNKSNREHQASRVHKWACVALQTCRSRGACHWLAHSGRAKCHARRVHYNESAWHCKPAGVGVHAAGWLIQKDDCRATQKGDGYAQLASLPTRQITSRRVQLAVKPYDSNDKNSP